MPDGLLLKTDKMLAHKVDGIGTMTFNNPERRNAVSMEMWEAAETILTDFRDDPSVRVIVVTGAGDKAFVSGADISKFESERNSMEDVQRYNAQTARVYDLLYDLPKPTIAQIKGYCVGGGTALAVCCDLRICGEDSRFAIPAAKLGLGYGFTGMKRLADIVGPAFAKEILFTARLFDAEEARIMGLINRVVPKEQVEATVAEYARTICENAPLTVSAAKQILNETQRDAAARDMAKVDALVAGCFASEDYKEGRRAFMEKRKPNFQGR
jgi:enoyl-CoA hydratase/carnithine racemase